MYRKRLGSFMALGTMAFAVTQCQPACTPVTPAPVETTTVVEETTTTVEETTTTVEETTTTTQAAAANPLNIRWDGYTCDEHQTMSGWISHLAVLVRHDGPWDAPGVDVTYESQDGSLTTEWLGNLNPGETYGYGYVPWPRVGALHPSQGGDETFHIFRDSTRVRVSYQGNVILERTFTLDDVRTGEPLCAAVIDTPGVSG
jgi:hypothetical protein